MFPSGKTGKEIMRILTVLFLVMVSVATVGFAGASREEPLVLIVRPELLPATSSSNSNVLVQTRNPFIWPASQKSKLEALDGTHQPDPFAELFLQGIIWVDGIPVAIINNKQLREGDMIDAIKVGEITRDSVVMATKKIRRTLRFPSAEIDFGTISDEVE
jgi:hypothetical protein